MKRNISTLFFSALRYLALSTAVVIYALPALADDPFAFYIYDNKTKAQMRRLKDADWFPEKSDYMLLARPRSQVHHVEFQADCLPDTVVVAQAPFVVTLPPVMKMCTIHVYGKTIMNESVSQFSVVLSTHKNAQALDPADMDWRTKSDMFGYATTKDQFGNIQTIVSDIPEEVMGVVGAKQLERRNRSMASMAPEFDSECKFTGNCKGNGPAGKIVMQGSARKAVDISDGAVLSDFVTGNFETTCTVSHYAYVDPLRMSTSDGSNLTMFWGNTTPPVGLAGVLPKSEIRSTCRGGALDGSSYWAPAMLDAKGLIVEPSEIRVNYAVDTEYEDASKVYSFPTGFKMTTGFPNAKFPMGLGLGNFSCDNQLSSGMPICKKSDLEMQVNFLYCWNGVKENNKDQRIQLERAELPDGDPRPSCPPSHPYVLPRITYTIVYSTPTEGTKGWRLSSDRYSSEKTKAGYSVYGGFVDGWDPQIKKTWMDRCVRDGMLCLKGKLGDGRQLTP